MRQSIDTGRAFSVVPLVALLVVLAGCPSASVSTNGCKVDSECANGTFCQPRVCDTDLFICVTGESPCGENETCDEGQSICIAENPGEPVVYASPEETLADVNVQVALDEFRDSGFSFAPSLEPDPPGLAGTYRREPSSAVFVATSNGEDVGDKEVGAEFTITDLGQLLIAIEGVNFRSNGETVTEYDATGLFVRGTGNDFTIYAARSNECVEGGGDFTTFALTITTGSVDPTTGDLVDVIEFSLTQATTGVSSFTCDRLLVGEDETVGGWSVAEQPLTSRID